ncbi:MAG: hypothetical protein HOP03_06895 [Lysobacter sp.]|nr:hypothetical protein [Lysobacter sp.]
MTSPDYRTSHAAPSRPAADGHATVVAVPDASIATRFVLCDDVALESQDDTHVTLVNRASSARSRLSRAAYRFLRGFDAPRTLQQAAAGGDGAALLAQVRQLIARGLLVDADAPATVAAPRLRTAVAYRFCNAPSPLVAADFVVLGVPYDLGGDGDCRDAPAAIRRKSFDYAYQLRVDDGRPRGWFDANRGTRILEGATIADAGDVFVEYGEDQRTLFARIGAALAGVGIASRGHAGGSVPVVLGGDRSITAAVAAHLGAGRPLTVVQFAATPALGEVQDPRSVAADAVGTHVSRLPGIRAFHAFCCRFDGATDNADTPANARGSGVVHPAARLRRDPPDAIARALGTALDLHLSIDLGLARMAPLASDGASVRDLALHEIDALIRALGAAHRIVGIDLVGLDLRADAPTVSTAIACHLAMTAMDAAYAPHRSDP